jgi:preprotein translocase subunit SecE
MAVPKTGNRIQMFFKDRVGELNNVTWPTQKQAVHSMILVLIIMLIVGVFLGFVDAILSEIVLYLIG